MRRVRSVEVVDVGVVVGVTKNDFFEKVKKICKFFKTSYTLPRLLYKNKYIQ